MKKLWILLALGIALGTACTEDDATEPVVNSEIGISGFDPAEVVPLEGGAVEVTVNSSATWRLTGEKTWCKPSVVKGESGEKVTFTAEPNDTGDSRSIIYKFFCGNKTIPFTVTQAPSNIFSIDSNPVYEVVSSGGNVIVKLSSNIDYTFKVEEDGKDWITAPQTRGVTTDRVTFRVGANDLYDSRTGHITFTANGKDYPVTINQKQLDKLTLDQTAISVIADGETISVTVNTNVEYTVEYEGAAGDWIHRVAAPAASGTTRGVADHVETFTIDAAKAPRSGKIIFKAVDAALAPFVTVDQEGPSVSYAEFPDAAFANWLKGKGYIIAAADAPGKYLVTETGLKLTKLAFQVHAINSTAGIEAFPNLLQLETSGNGGTRVANYILGSSKIWELYLPRLGNVPNVVVSGENVTDISFPLSAFLVTLDVSNSPKVKSINVSNCAKMTTIYLKTGQTVGSIQKPDGCTIVYKD